MNAKTILIVEDNELNMKLVTALLKRAEYTCLQSPDAETGLKMAKQSRPDLILMDIQLPGLDGLSAVRLLKNDDRLREIPVVALTGYAMHGDYEKAIAAGCSGYITKPINTREFLDQIAQFMH